MIQNVTMDQFLKGLAKEKENPYHPMDAYPGTEFARTETRLKSLSPLIEFQLDKGLSIILHNQGRIQEVIEKHEFRYYLNYVIIPSIGKYRNSLQKDCEDMGNFVKGNIHRDDFKEFMNTWDPGINIDNVNHFLEYLQKHGLVSEYGYHKQTQFRNTINKIDKVITDLIHFDGTLDESLQRIQDYLQTIKFASVYDIPK
jgi:hypothetical protein